MEIGSELVCVPPPPQERVKMFKHAILKVENILRTPLVSIAKASICNAKTTKYCLCPPPVTWPKPFSVPPRFVVILDLSALPPTKVGYHSLPSLPGIKVRLWWLGAFLQYSCKFVYFQLSFNILMIITQH